ncbi:MAG: hypothetical protein AB7K71_38585 [Polyangiaceae bacterium]
MADADLKELFERVKQCFPEEKRALFREPTGEALWEHLSGELQNGYVRRWFEVTEGMQADEPFCNGLRLVSTAQSIALKYLLTRAPDGDGRSFDRHWFPIADGVSEYLVVDERDGRLLRVFRGYYWPHDVAPSLEAWLGDLARDAGTGLMQWRSEYGLVDV